MKKLICLIFVMVFFFLGHSQNLSPVLGVGDERPEIFAFTNATIVIDHETVLQNADMIIKKGKIEAVAKSLEIPENAVVFNLNGKYIYPSFIDLYSTYGINSKVENNSASSSYSRQQVFDSKTDGPFYWNDAIKPFVKAIEQFHVNATAAADLRKAGFGAVVTQENDGIMRGISALVSLADNDEEKVVLKGNATCGYSLDKGSSQMSYPGSLMGAFALLRQTFYDAQWYAAQTNKSIFDGSLEAITANKEIPSVFQVRDKINLLDVAKLGKEFDIPFIMKGNGDEYQLLDEIAASGASLILPLNFPAAPDVGDMYKEILVPFEDLKHWEMAPYNTGKVAEKDIEFSLTTDGLKDKKQFRTNLLKAIKYGLNKEEALKALTQTPAKLIGCDDLLGSLEKGKIANFLITSTDIFDTDCIVYENWIQGEKYEITNSRLPQLHGDYKITLNNNEKYTVTINGKPGKYSLKVKAAKNKTETGKITVSENLISLSIPVDKKWMRLSGYTEGDKFTGTGVLADGEAVEWEMTLLKKTEAEKNKENDKISEPGKVIHPFVAYGNESLPEYNDFIIRNATVWTLEEKGVLENADVLVRNGKIAQVGKNIQVNSIQEIDGTGMHVTPGIIDEHSHMALNGTNEATHAITSEVRMSDVVNPEDLTLYRQLAGGVTCSHLLHGSANPIGGQSVIVKLRWGKTPDEMVVKDQVGFLKHALGENVKQSRLASSSRFPQTRMGVEQSIRDVYVRAKEYQKKWDTFNSLSENEKQNTTAPRKDLQLEAIVDMFTEKSFMVCHAYVQSETNMIMKLAEEFDIKPHTLIHNTEGYKVANQMRETGAAGSVFSDWWAYKYEVYDAIPYNAALQAKQGVLVCINSDDAEMGRRLNQEAGKIVKYGGLSEVEALKLVTLNPAKILHLDHRMGSIKTGKDADLVLWTDNPLSVYAKAAKTIVDGVIYYDMDKDKEMYYSIQAERSRIINRILSEGGGKRNGTEDKNPAVRVNDQFIYDNENITDYSVE